MTEDSDQGTAPGEATGASNETQAKKKGWKKGLFFFLKLAFSVGMLWVIFDKVLTRDGAEGLGERIADLSWGWVAAAIAIGYRRVADFVPPPAAAKMTQ